MYRPSVSRYSLLILFVCTVVACAALFAPTGRVQTKDSNFHQQISRSLRSYDELRMSPADTELTVRQTGRLTLETSAGTFDIRLVPNDVRAPNYRAIAVKDGGEIVELAREPSRTFEGVVEGLEGSQARFTIDRGTIEGMIIARGEKFFVEPAAHYTGDAAPGDFLFYRESDVIPGNAVYCGVETLAEKVNEEFLRSSGPTLRAAVLSPAREAEIATDVDFEYFQASGNSAAAANNDILGIINQVNGVYRSEIGMTFKVIFQRVWTTSADPYDATTLSGLLDQVRTQWKTAPPAGTESRDLVHMWTGRDLDGFTTGLAYSQVTVNGVPSNGVVCRFQEFAVGVSERQTLVPQKFIVPAHEIGHNLSAQHPEQVGHPECALTIMSGTVLTNTVFSFCQFSRDEITNYVNSFGSCLTASTTGAAPTVQFSTTDYRVTEGAGSVQLTVTRSDGAGASTVDFQTIDGTANDRSDYTTALGTVRFAAGETSKSFNVFITDDAYGEGLETFQVQLTGATGASVGTPSAATVTITSNESVNGPNPVKDPTFNAPFFARQHYIDFLNREPDAGGLAFWTNQTTNCGNPDPLVCRINASAAFFLSIEYQETGFYAIRVQRVAFGRRSDNASRMTYRELIASQRFVGEGVVVGQAGYEQLLASNKLAYASAVVARTDFASRFPQTNADSYVDALFASAGVTPTPTERQEAINAYNGAGGGAAGRAAALRSAADAGSLRNAELRAAFVLLEYHGYMRRDPDDVGYGFWLGKLNQFNGNYVAAEMVKAFITSNEYQQRFGQ
ncbi:MAG TPA: Calx-beta domain-containing protein [Pyrinomonadaceae bacterium]|jgi:hypothetical protein|nr:Calx-beta domain-containing protein [Pyrinomonadaceae bacterium]